MRDSGEGGRDENGFWIGVTAVLFRSMTRLVARQRLSGLEHVPTEGPTLLVSNHLSYLDPVYLGVFVHRAGRLPRFLAKASLWDAPLIGRIMAGTGQIPVRPATGAPGTSLTEARRALDGGGVVVIFPEGIVNRRADGWPTPGRPGAAHLALERVDVAVVPVVVWGTQDIYDHHRRRFRPSPFRTVVVRAGAPIRLDDLRQRFPEASSRNTAVLREATNRMMAAVRGLLEEVRAGEPDTRDGQGAVD